MLTQYGIYDQIYRPTEIESSIKHNEKPIPSKGAKPPQGKLEARASKLEKGVGGLFRKLEKKYGLCPYFLPWFLVFGNDLMLDEATCM